MSVGDSSGLQSHQKEPENPRLGAVGRGNRRCGCRRPFGIPTRERLLGAALQFTVVHLTCAGYCCFFLSSAQGRKGPM
jgi:hypothetical protein